MNATQILIAEVRSTAGVSPNEFVSFFDEQELKLLRKVIRQEMEIVAEKDSERYEELNEYLGATITEIERYERRKEEEEARQERWNVYDNYWGSRPSWY